MSAKVILYILIVYSFICWLIVRESGVYFQISILLEVFLLLALIVAAVTLPKENWKNVKTDLFYLFLIWFIISLLEVFNPAGANPIGWLKEIRTAAEYPLLSVVVGLAVFSTNKDLDKFLIIVVGLSTLAALDGFKQLHIGLSRGDVGFLQSGGAVTHVLWGRLRVFSFYSEAAQFGASQAHIGLLTLILALGPIHKKWKVILLICSALMFYGMLISGTRGAMFALVPGAFFAILLSKKFKVLFFGGILAVLFLCFLKFTTIGNQNYNIYRFRSALNPDDPSLNVRLSSQKVLKDYMSKIPFGGGLGVIGANGMEHNGDKFLSKVQPDSYWVKVWAMYGIVGFTIWIGMMMYILGKCCGIVWKIQDDGLRVKAIALTSGVAGIIFCSYGNEVINTMPTSFVIHFSLVFMYLMPKLDREITERKLLNQS